MQTKILNVCLGLGLMLVGLFAGLASQSNGATPKPAFQRWEYKIITAGKGDYSPNEINNAGNSGWELVAVRSGADMAGYVLKRPMN
jgi:hypothetical protein